MKSILLLLFLSLNLHAINLDCVECLGQLNLDKNLNQQIDGLYKALEVDWWSATKSQVSNSSCRSSIPTIEEMKRYTSENTDDDVKGTRTVNGVTFENESLKLIKAYEDLTSIRNWSGDVEEQTDLQEEYEINPECKKVACALEKAYGTSLGNKILYMKMRYGFNSSEYGNKNASRLTNQEADVLLRSVQDYPASLFPLDSNRQLTKFKRGHTLTIHSGRTVAYAAIAFYDVWNYYSPEMMEYTAVHELAHYIGSELEIDDNTEWLNFGGWVEKDDEWESEKENTCSLYGATNPSEDFAESVSAYRFNPTLLKEISLEKYNYIKEVVFDGLEYTDNDSCRVENSYTFKLQEEVSKVRNFEQSISGEHDYNKIISQCPEETMNYVLNKPDALSLLDECIQAKGMTPLVISRALDSIDDLYEYDSLVENRLKNSSFDNVPQASEDKLQEIKRYLRNEVIDSILEREEERSYQFSYGDKNSSELCNSIWGKYAYQGLFRNNEELEYVLDPYSYSDQLDSLLNSVCNKIQGERKKPKRSSREEVEKALDYLTTTSQSESERLSGEINNLYALITSSEDNFKSLNPFQKVLKLKEYRKLIQDLKDQIADLEAQLY